MLRTKFASQHAYEAGLSFIQKIAQLRHLKGAALILLSPSYDFFMVKLTIIPEILYAPVLPKRVAKGGRP